jgi:hypothetical protein
MPKQRISKLAAALAIPLLLVALSACGTESADDAPDSGSNSPSTQTSRSAEDYQLAFAECMREQGIDMPDPNADGSVPAASGEGLMEAVELCQEDLGGAPPTVGDSGPLMSDEERQAESLKLAACFRDNGFDVPDPQPGEVPSIPVDAPKEVLEECAPNGVGSVPGTGGN